MSFYDYEQSKEIMLEDRPFYALIMAAMRQADTPNAAMLRTCWPETWLELQNRYHSVGGLLPSDE